MFQNIQHVHFVGIGGIGMSALAKWFLHAGIPVSGSDMHVSFITHDLEARGARIFSGHAFSNISDDVDLLIYSSAVPVSNIERVLAREQGIREISNVEFLGELSKQFSTIVVSGTHGKSTTTAMLGLILEAAGYDPTVLVGSLVPEFSNSNIRIGRGRFFVIEGCEYRAHMLQMHPEMIVLTNIEEDHLDYYRNLTHIQDTFQTFVNKLQSKGMVVMNADDPVSQTLQVNQPVMYGTKGTYTFSHRVIESGMQIVQTNLGELRLKIPGVFNVMNTLAATAAAMEIGVPFDICQKTLERFSGIWRRFERVGVWKGADIISDYAHHPTAISQTIKATREFFPERRILLCFQPHQHNRTKELFNGFVQALALADHLILCEIYDVAGRNEDQSISSKQLVQTIAQQHPGKDIRFAKDLHEAKQQLRRCVKPMDIVLIMGAGDVDSIARELI